jgi:hypothetical protein
MTFTEDCPEGRSQDLTCVEADGKILVDRKKFKRVCSLLLSSVDELAYARHREIFLKSLRKLFFESVGLDDSGCVQARLLLEAYSDPVFPKLAQLDSNLEEAFNLIREVNHD